MKKKITIQGKTGDRRREDVVLLDDLTPRDDVQGGSGKLRFGQGAARADRPRRDQTASFRYRALHIETVLVDVSSGRPQPGR